MAGGPGKYDAACTRARHETGGSTVILLVLDGKYGSGFSVQSTMIDSKLHLPGLLEEMARGIREGEDEGQETKNDLPVLPSAS